MVKRYGDVVKGWHKDFVMYIWLGMKPCDMLMGSDPGHVIHSVFTDWDKGLVTCIWVGTKVV